MKKENNNNFKKAVETTDSLSTAGWNLLGIEAILKELKAESGARQARIYINKIREIENWVERLQSSFNSRSNENEK